MYNTRNYFNTYRYLSTSITIGTHILIQSKNIHIITLRRIIYDFVDNDLTFIPHLNFKHSFYTFMCIAQYLYKVNTHNIFVHFSIPKNNIATDLNANNNKTQYPTTFFYEVEFIMLILYYLIYFHALNISQYCYT